MIFQGTDTILLIVGLILATVILFLVLYIVEMYAESKTFAHDKKAATLLVAFIGVFLVPIIAGAIGYVFGAIEHLINAAQAALGAQQGHYLSALVPVFAFLLFWAFTKWILGLRWDKSCWIALIGLIILYLVWTIFPQIPNSLAFGLVV